MVTFKKREIIYRPYEPFLKMIVDIVMIICVTYLLVIGLCDHTKAVGYSMNDTLQNGDTIMINKITYKFSSPKRYDVIVFEPDIANVSKYYIKRIIGLPGETIQILDGHVCIDGKVLEDDVIDTTIFNAGLADEPITLDYDEYFVLGDNRNNSEDSRFSNVGLVKKSDIIGKTWFIMYPFSDFGPVKAVSPQTTDEEPTQ